MEAALFRRRIFAGAFFAIFSLNLSAAIPAARDYPIRPVPPAAVRLDDAFWTPRLETNRVVTIPYAFGRCQTSGCMDNFARAAAVLRGENIASRKPPGFPFDDTDPYEILEGAAYELAVRPDPGLSARLDSFIAEFAAAQEPDGYLYTARTIDPQHPHPWAGTNRWVNEENLSYELYNAGRLFAAAAAHYQATGKTNLLSIAVKEANLLGQTFGPGTSQLHLWPGHETVETGLVQLYRVTGDPRYLNLAQYFIDVRGSVPGGDDYNQSRIPPVDQTGAAGHAVDAGYLYCGMTDVAALTGDPRYVRAIDAIWENAVGKKLYLTGGSGARAKDGTFGNDYELPNLTAANETGAAVAGIFWNERLFLLHGDARYVDVLERTLYNGLLSGVSLNGTNFFDANPLESDGSHQRSPWLDCAGCSGSIARFLPSVPGYVYAQAGDTIYVNLYAGSTADFKLNNGRNVKITQETRYPWKGAVKMTLQLDWQKSMKFTLNVRIPGWARNEVAPGGLYKFSDNVNEPVTLAVNGRDVPMKLDKGYVSLDRAWSSGDVIELQMPMLIRHVTASENVPADRGRVALQRGPIVFCAEWPDTPNGRVRKLFLPDDQPLTTRFDPVLLNGVQVIEGKGFNISTNEFGKAFKRLQDFTTIPYFAWANRGSGEMTVWIPTSENAVPTR